MDSNHSEQMERTVPANSRSLSNQFTPNYQQGSPDEIDIFDLIAILGRRWHWLLTCLAGSTAAASFVAFLRTPLYEISVPIELPTEAVYKQFSLPKVSLGEGDSLSMEEDSRFSQEIILNLINRKVKSPQFAREWQSNGSIKTFVLDVKDPTGKANNTTIRLEGTDPTLLFDGSTALLESLAVQIRSDFAQQLTRRLEDRINEAGQTRIKLRQLAQNGIKNQLIIKQYEVDIKKKNIIDKIASLEKEATLKRMNQLDAIQEKRDSKRLEIDRRLRVLHNLATVQRQDRIAQLEEAARIAAEIEDENGQLPGSYPITSKIYSTENNTNSPLYLRGKKALLAEMEQLRLQTNDSMIIPEIRDLENGLDLIQDDIQYEIMKARKSNANFDGEIPSLRTQLELLEKDAELAALKHLASSQQNIDAYIKELPLLEGDIIRSNRLMAAVPKIQIMSYQLIDKVPVIQQPNRRWIIVIGGVFAGLLLAMISAFIADRWQLRKIEKYT